MSLGKQVRFYRNKLHLTLAQLSELSGVDVGTISALEQRNSNKSQFAADLAIAFGLSVEQLLDESTDHLTGAPAHPGPMHPSVATAREPRKHYAAWPFKTIASEDLAALPPDRIAAIEGFIRGLIFSQDSSQPNS